MRVTFEFFNEPILLYKNKASVIYLENKKIYRDVIGFFYNECPEESGIIFSKDFKPIKFKNNVVFIPDIFHLDFSSTFIKKIYEDMERYSNEYMQEDVTALKNIILNFTEKLCHSFDRDFICLDDVDLTDLFKIQGIKPDLGNSSMLEALLNYVVLLKKYSKTEIFVFHNLHNYFESDEIETFYKELMYHEIYVLDIEHCKIDATLEIEKNYVLDKDLCEIVERD